MTYPPRSRRGATSMPQITLNLDTDVLLLVDVQPTFMPGGSLAVPDGDKVISPINKLLGIFEHAIATQDWHPVGHSSFASVHADKKPFDTIELSYGVQTLWPDHGVQGSREADIHPVIDERKIELIVRKG